MAGDVIRGEELAAYTRWQAEDFSAPPAKPGAKEANVRRGGQFQGSVDSDFNPAEASDGEVEVSHVALPQRLPTAEDIAQIHEEARQNGYRIGFGEGRTAGYEEGLRAGHADGHQDGFESGRQAGFREGAAAAKNYEEEIHRLCQGLQGAMTVFDQEVAESALACALEVAGQLTRAALRVQPEMLLPIIQEALAALPLHHGPVTLCLAEADVALAREHLEGQFTQEGWAIQVDNSLKQGDCRIYSGTSEVDARLESRWRRVLEGIGLSPEWLENKP
ncbi:MAG: flagellar assembly protein FliH [Betaproteobacteria bacterium]|nr:flagellar assembly protein FliH [Betaproteobacteria bacterium]